LITFKKGAFAAIAPVNIKCIKYTNPRFSPSIDVYGELIAFVGSMCQFWNGVTVYEFDTFNPEYLNITNEEQWPIYAKYAREVMSKVLKCNLSDQGHRDSIEYFKKLQELEKTRKETDTKKEH